jgi:hypothetical protein
VRVVALTTRILSECGWAVENMMVRASKRVFKINGVKDLKITIMIRLIDGGGLWLESVS